MMNFFKKLCGKKTYRRGNTGWFNTLATDEYRSLAGNIFRYDFDDIGKLDEGVSFLIKGTLLLNCEKFSIDFINTENNDIPLHIRSLIPHNYVIRSCRINEVWPKVEVSSSIRFVLRRGHKFYMEILITDECYMIAINGHHYAEYKHRVPYHSVNYIEIKGEIENVTVLRQIVETYPSQIQEFLNIRIQTSFMRELLKDLSVYGTKTPNIPAEFKTIKLGSRHLMSKSGLFSLPYYARFETNLTKGCCVKIEGRVKVLPHSFSINLQQGHFTWPRPNVAFHFSSRYMEKVKDSAYQEVVVCKSFYDRQWSSELCLDIHEDLQPGQTFSLIIMCNKHSYEVYINQRWLLDYKYCIDPDIVDIIYIEGDINLWDVVMDTEVFEDEHRKFLKRPEEANIYEY